MPYRGKRARAPKRRCEEIDLVASKRAHLESTIPTAQKPYPKPSANKKCKNLAANRLDALRNRLRDSIESNSEKTTKGYKSTSATTSADFVHSRGTQASWKLTQTGSTENHTKHPIAKDLKVSTVCLHPSKKLSNRNQNHNSNEANGDGTIIITDDSPVPSKHKLKEPWKSPIKTLSRDKCKVRHSSPFSLATDFIVVSDADSDRHESLLSANKRIIKIRNSISSTSSFKTLTPNSIEKLNSSHGETFRGVNIPRTNLFETPKQYDTPDVQCSQNKNETSVPSASEKESSFCAYEKGSILQVTESPNRTSLQRSFEIKKSPMTTGLIGSKKEQCKGESNEIATHSFHGEKIKSSLADRIKKIKNSKVPFKRTSTIINEETQEIPVVPPASELASNLNCENISKASLVENWIDSAYPQARNNQSMNDSMLVNLNETIFGRSELLHESQADESMDWDAISEPSENQLPPMPLPGERKHNIICLVTDTNVFMHDLPKLQEILNFKVLGNQKLIIYIPWMVLKELDHIKDQSGRNSIMKSQALTAQKFINKALVERDSKIVGQSVNEVCMQMDLGKDPDDKILACSLQAKDKYATVILLSNDINLRNKALTNDLQAYSPKDVVAKLKCNKFVQIKVKLQVLLSQIVFQCCKEVYGDACSKMEMLQNCPWSFEGCLKRFKRYWTAVFKELLLKQCLKTIEDLIFITERGDVADSNATDFDQFKSKVKEFLFFLQDIDKYNAAAKQMRLEMDSILEDDHIL